MTATIGLAVTYIHGQSAHLHTNGHARGAAERGKAVCKKRLLHAEHLDT